MYPAIFLAALISSSVSARVSLSIGQEFAHGSGYRFQLVEDSEIRKVVQSAVYSIDKIARAPWKAEQKLTAIHQIYEKVKNYRARSWSRSPSTELKLDLLIGPYESFPMASSFRKQNCQNYYSTLKIDWEPTAIAEPSLKGVKRAWDNLKIICHS